MKRRSKHSLSHFNLLTTSMGYITPIQCVEVLPGDSFLQDNSVFIRTMPLVAPVMHPVHAEIRSFFVPTRIIWTGFTDFITGGPDGLNADTPPYFIATAENTKLGELNDYLGVPPDILAGTQFSALPARAYNAIFNEYFRDQDIDEEVPLSLESGEDTTTSFTLQRADWRKDYFTLARPFEQKGVAAEVPIRSSGGAITGLTATTTISGNGQPTFKVPTTGTGSGNICTTAISPISVSSYTQSHCGKYSSTLFTNNQSGAGHYLSWDNPALNATTTVDGNASFELGAMTISDFREAMALQRFQEKRALYGSRYEDYQAFLGIRSSDARLQHPEYLGGGQRTIQFSEVLQTAEGTDPVGSLRGHGIGALKTRRFMRFFNEHGYVLSILIIRPMSIYTQGLNRMFSRKTKYDYWQAETQHIGQQALLNKELYAASDKGDEVFGYTNKYNEYRHHPSNVHGEFRNYYEDWHLGRKFTATPVLNSDFLKCHPSNRIFAETTDNYDKLLVMAQNSIRARRIISQIGDPI